MKKNHIFPGIKKMIEELKKLSERRILCYSVHPLLRLFVFQFFLLSHLLSDRFWFILEEASLMKHFVPLPFRKVSAHHILCGLRVWLSFWRLNKKYIQSKR